MVSIFMPHCLLGIEKLVAVHSLQNVALLTNYVEQMNSYSDLIAVFGFLFVCKSS